LNQGEGGKQKGFFPSQKKGVGEIKKKRNGPLPVPNRGSTSSAKSGKGEKIFGNGKRDKGKGGRHPLKKNFFLSQ